MSSEKFIQNNLALTTLTCACAVVLISLSVRQVFGMFFIDFNNDLGISSTEFGLAIGIQMLGCIIISKCKTSFWNVFH